MKKYVLFLCFLSGFSNSFSQGLDNLWLMGYDNSAGLPFGGTNINFNSGSPVVTYVNRPMNIGSSNAVICNSFGDLLFYTNGVYIANANNVLMLNGDSLNPSAYTTQEIQLNAGLSITQSDIIIPFPEDSTKYYLFHETLDSAAIIPTNLYYTIIDMSLDGGLGGVLTKNNVLFQHALYFGGLTACKHANGRDWWLITHEYGTNRYFKFLITPQGITSQYQQSIGKVFDVDSSGLGQVVFSPNGSKFAYYDTERDLDLFDFDRCSGAFSNLIHVDIHDSAFVCGVAFSPDSKKLYLSSDRYVYQFDLNSTNIPNSQTTVAIWDSFASPSPLFHTTFCVEQLASDGKIYIATGNGTDYLHVINYPDSLGLSCDVCQHCVHLPTYNALTILNSPNYFLGADTTSSICDTLHSAILNIPVQNEITLFPNPVHEKFYAVLSQHLKIKSVKIFNLFGQEVFVSFSFLKNGEYLEVNTTSLSQGVYFLELLSDKEKVVKRFVKE